MWRSRRQLCRAGARTAKSSRMTPAAATRPHRKSSANGPFTGLTFQLVGMIDVDRGVVVIEVEGNSEGHGRFGCCQDDDKQCDQLAIESQRAFTQIFAAEGDEVDVRAVEDQ